MHMPGVVEAVVLFKTNRTGRQFREEGEPLLAPCEGFIRLSVWVGQPHPMERCEQASTLYKMIVCDKDVRGCAYLFTFQEKLTCKSGDRNRAREGGQEKRCWAVIHFAHRIKSSSSVAISYCWVLVMRLKNGRARVRRAMDSVTGSSDAQALGWASQAGCR
jgi:hypothetical protein